MMADDARIAVNCAWRECPRCRIEIQDELQRFASPRHEKGFVHEVPLSRPLRMELGAEETLLALLQSDTVHEFAPPQILPLKDPRLPHRAAKFVYRPGESEPCAARLDSGDYLPLVSGTAWPEIDPTTTPLPNGLDRNGRYVVISSGVWLTLSNIIYRIVSNPLLFSTSPLPEHYQPAHERNDHKSTIARMNAGAAHLNAKAAAMCGVQPALSRPASVSRMRHERRRALKAARLAAIANDVPALVASMHSANATPSLTTESVLPGIIAVEPTPSSSSAFLPASASLTSLFGSSAAVDLADGSDRLLQALLPVAIAAAAPPPFVETGVGHKRRTPMGGHALLE
jgi:hypothetical protein